MQLVVTQARAMQSITYFEILIFFDPLRDYTKKKVKF